LHAIVSVRRATMTQSTLGNLLTLCSNTSCRRFAELFAVRRCRPRRSRYIAQRNKRRDALQSAQPCLLRRRVAVKRFSIASVTITLSGKPLRLEYARSCESTSGGILNVAGTNGSPSGIARRAHERLADTDTLAAARCRVPAPISWLLCRAASPRQQAMRRVQVQGFLRFRSPCHLT
jgi:hypothetical protein